MASGILDHLQVLQQALHAAHEGIARGLPQEVYTHEKGFTWANVLQAIRSEGNEKEAVCVRSTTATMVTQQVVTGTDECEFILQVIDAGGEAGETLFFGVVDTVPSGFGYLPIGHPHLPSSIGIAAYPSCGAVVHGGRILGEAPGVKSLVKSGDTVKVKISEGSRVAFHVGARCLHEVVVRGDGKFRCAVSMSSKGQRVKILDKEISSQSASSAASSSGGFRDLYSALLRQVGLLQQQQRRFAAAVAERVAVGGSSGGAAGAGASPNGNDLRLPNERYDASKGFTWVNTLISVDCKQGNKVATCVISRTATLITAQVFSKEDECDFILKVVCVGGEEEQPITFGIVGVTPTGFATLPIGHSDLKPSIGARCGKRESAIVTDGEKKGLFPPLNDGDLVKVRVSRGSRISLCKGSESHAAFTVGGDGRFRIATSFASRGQRVEIIDATPRISSPGRNVMKVGSEVDMPRRCDPRLGSMRTRYSEEVMGSHCGRITKVVEVSKRSVRTSLDGMEFSWDMELFPREVRRCCYKGCELVDAAVLTPHRVCDICLVRVPLGAKTRRCDSHDYDICAHCEGIREVPSVGSNVIRGPTWMSKDLDGTPYAEGLCKSAPDSRGLVSVEWQGGSQSLCRVTTHYQDIWAARNNGLLGKRPVDQNQDVVCLGSAGQHVCIQDETGERSAKRRRLLQVVPHVDVGTRANDLKHNESQTFGQGGFGVVHRGKLWGDDVVVKEVLAAEMTKNLKDDFEHEVQVLGAIRHRNLVMVTAMNVERRLIVTEFCELGNLKGYLEKEGQLASADHRQRLMLDVAKGMACIAGHGVVHRNLKPENVLISSPGPVAKVGDCALIEPLVRCQTASRVAHSIVYLAPEVFLGHVSEKSDVYAFSLLLAFAFGMREPDLSSLTEMEAATVATKLKQDAAVVHDVVIQAIRNGKGLQIPEFVPAEIKTLVQEGRDEKPEKRPTFVSLCGALAKEIAAINFLEALERSRSEAH